MKIKPIIKEESIYNIVRYNSNIGKNHISIRHGSSNMDKKEYSNLVLLSLMNLSGLTDKARKELGEDASGRKLISKIIDNANKEINNTFTRDTDIIMR